MLEQYSRWADSQLGRWQVKADGYRDPSVRTLFKPLLGMFHGAPSCKKWKMRVDGLLKEVRLPCLAAVACQSLLCALD